MACGISWSRVEGGEPLSDTGTARWVDFEKSKQSYSVLWKRVKKRGLVLPLHQRPGSKGVGVGVALLTAVVAVWSALRFGRCCSLLLLVQTFYFGQFPSVPPITARLFNYHIIPCMYNYLFPISDPLHITPGSRRICLFSVVPSRLSHGFFYERGGGGGGGGIIEVRMCCACGDVLICPTSFFLDTATMVERHVLGSSSVP